MKAIRRFYRNLSFTWRFSVIYTLLILIQILLVGIISYDHTVKTTIQQSDKEMIQNVLEYKQSILNVLRNTETLTDEIVFRSEARTYLNNRFIFNDKEAYYFTYIVQNALIQTKNMYPNQYYKIRFFSENNTIGEIYDFLYSMERVESMMFFADLKDSDLRTQWGMIKSAEVFFSKGKSFESDAQYRMVLPYYYKVYSYKKERMIGILEIDILLEKIFVNAFYNNRLYILDENNEIVHLNGRKNTIKNIDIDMQGLTNGVTELVIGEEKYRVVYDTIDELGYKIVQLVPMTQLLESIQTYSKKLIGIVIFSIVGSFTIVFFMNTLLFKSLSVLSRTICRVRNGEMSVRLKEEGENDISKLAHHFNLMMDELEESTTKLIEKEVSQRDAEIRALQSQVNPHFLYNTLDSVRMQCEVRGEQDIADVIISISKLFRYNTKWTNELVTLREEIEHVNNYMTIMKSRFDEKIEFKLNVSNNLEDCMIIKMLLQPLIENCFKYAFNNSEGGWIIDICAYTSNGVLTLKVIDNGHGINEEKLKKINNSLAKQNVSIRSPENQESVGLWNLSRRIKIHFGSKYTVKILSENNKGTTVVVEMPVIKKKQDKIDFK